MNSKYLHTLEYMEIISLLNNFTKTYIGKNKISNLVPSFDKDDVSNLLLETTEGINLIYRKGSLPLSSIFDITLWIKKLESFSPLSSKALLETASILKISRELKEYFFADEDFDTLGFPILYEYFNMLYTNKGIEEKIFDIILDENTIADNASPKLAALRRQSKKLEQDIKDKLSYFIHSSTYSKYIMDPIITIRNDRYVIPVKEEYKNNVKGFIHDVSSTRFYSVY